MKTEPLDAFIVSVLESIDHKPGTHLDAASLRMYTNEVVARCATAAEEIKDRYRPKQGQSYGDEMLRMGRISAENCVNAIKATIEGKE